MEKTYHVTKLDIRVNGSTMKDRYLKNIENALKELLKFKDVLYTNVWNYECF